MSFESLKGLTHKTIPYLGIEIDYDKNGFVVDENLTMKALFDANITKFSDVVFENQTLWTKEDLLRLISPLFLPAVLHLWEKNIITLASDYGITKEWMCRAEKTKDCSLVIDPDSLSAENLAIFLDNNEIIQRFVASLDNYRNVANMVCDITEDTSVLQAQKQFLALVSVFKEQPVCNIDYFSNEMAKAYIKQHLQKAFTQKWNLQHIPEEKAAYDLLKSLKIDVHNGNFDVSLDLLNAVASAVHKKYFFVEAFEMYLEEKPYALLQRPENMKQWLDLVANGEKGFEKYRVIDKNVVKDAVNNVITFEM